MHDITSTLPVGVNLPLGFNAKWPPHVNRRRAPGVLRLGFNGYAFSLFCVLDASFRGPFIVPMTWLSYDDHVGTVLSIASST